MNAELEDAIKDCFDRHKVPEKQRQAILDWCEKAEIAHGLLENVRTGTMDVVGITKGEPRFSLTAQGIKYVEGMMKKKPD